MQAQTPKTTATRPRNAPARRPRTTQPTKPIAASTKTRVSIQAVYGKSICQYESGWPFGALPTGAARRSCRSCTARRTGTAGSRTR